MTETRNSRRTLEGLVTSDKMEKTITVLVTRTYQHAKYKKFVRARKTYKVHDETNQCKVGDRVRIEETRPLSRDKRWRLKTVLERAKV